MMKFQAVRIISTSEVFEVEARSIEHARAIVQCGPLEDVGLKEGVTSKDCKTVDNSYVVELKECP